MAYIHTRIHIREEEGITYAIIKQRERRKNRKIDPKAEFPLGKDLRQAWLYLTLHSTK